MLGQLLHRRGRAITLAVGILVAAVSFTLLTSSARTSELRVKRTVAENFRPAYDILVRPPGSFTELERDEGLIQQNYLSGIFGGITRAQYRTVEDIPGVEVAAPIANVGFVPPFEAVPIEITSYLSKAPESLYRLKVRWLANNDLSRYPDQDAYIYLTRQDPFVGTGNGGYAQRSPGSRARQVCGDQWHSGQPVLNLGPFSLNSNIELGCFSKLTPKLGGYRVDFGSMRYPRVGTVRTAYFPMLVAAVDPVKEEQLLGLSDAIVSGRMLPANEPETRPSGVQEYIRLIASTRTYVDERVEVTVELLDTPSGRGTSRALSRSGAFRFATALEGRRVGRFRIPLGPIYERLLEALSARPRDWDVGYPGYWQTSPTRYGVTGKDHITPHRVHNPASVFDNSYYGCCWAPQQNRDVQYRRLTSFQGNLGGNRVPDLVVVGRYDPERLPGFSELSEVPLETYYPPSVEGADARTRALLGDELFLPTQNLGGYVSQPPLLLTSLDGLRSLTNWMNFNGADDSAPLSVIRVRVAGVRGPDPLSRERIRAVADAIHQRTGLAVDVTAGSSPHPVTVALPPGDFGQPSLLLKEGWVEKGVAVRFLDAIDRKSLALFALILVICTSFLTNAAFASVRSRRAEIGTLMCLGWSRAKVFGAVVGELASIGSLAGVVGTLVAAGAVAGFELEMPLARTLFVAPVAALLAIVAGLPPAWRASRGAPLDSIASAAVAPRQPHPVKTMAAMARANLMRLPARTAVGSLGLVLGVGALTLLLALNNALQGTLVGTLLGNHISVQVRSVDVVSVLLVILLGTASVADVLFLNLKERASEVASLSTSGWTDRHLTRLVLLEAFGMGLVSSALGAALGLGMSALVRGVAVAPSAGVALAVMIGAVVVTLAACAIPLRGLARLTPTTVLAEE